MSAGVSAISQLRELVAFKDGRIQLLYDTAVKALDELDRDYIRRPVPPQPPTIPLRRTAS